MEWASDVVGRNLIVGHGSFGTHLLTYYLPFKYILYHTILASLASEKTPRRIVLVAWGFKTHLGFQTTSGYYSVFDDYN